jgi:Ca2+-binding RTX toxin-like protein
MYLQTLERRRLLSVAATEGGIVEVGTAIDGGTSSDGVTVIEGYPGFFEIHGGDAADTIAVEFRPDGALVVNEAVYGVAEYVSVFSYGGDDTVTVGRAGQFVGASVIAGPGNDSVSVNCAGGVWGEQGNDVLRLTNAFRGEVYGGGGDDKLYLSGESFDCRIEGGDGNDSIDAGSNNYSVFVVGGGGDDTIFGSNYDDQLHGNGGVDFLFGGGGNDHFYSVDAEQDRLVGGAGIDTAFADPSEAGVWGIEYVFYVA